MKHLDITHKFEKGEYILYYCSNQKKLSTIYRDSLSKKIIRIFEPMSLNDTQSFLKARLLSQYVVTESHYQDSKTFPKLKLTTTNFVHPPTYSFLVEPLLTKTASFILSEEELLMAIDAFNYNSTSSTNSRIPKILMPHIKKTFPTLTASEIVGVQPMNSPVGFNFNIRTNYENN